MYSDPIVITENTRIRARARNDAFGWSDRVEAGYVTDPTPLVVTEIMYEPEPRLNDSFGALLYEFIEFHNPTDEEINLEGVFLNRPGFNFASNGVTTLGAGEYIVVVRYLPAFRERYGDAIPVAGEFAGGLSGSQRILVNSAAGESIMDFTYSGASWYPMTAGEGHSLVIRSATQSLSLWNSSSGWRASLFVGGSPGTDDTEPPPGLRVQGDVDGDGTLGISDVLALLFSLVGQRAQPCFSTFGNEVLQDVDGDLSVTVNDAVHLLYFLFLNGSAPVMGLDCTPISGCPPGCG